MSGDASGGPDGVSGSSREELLASVHLRAAMHQKAGALAEAEADFRWMLAQTDAARPEGLDWRRTAQFGLYEVLLAQGRDEEAERIGCELLLEERPDLREASDQLVQTIATVSAAIKQRMGLSTHPPERRVPDSLLDRMQQFLAKQQQIAELANAGKASEAVAEAVAMEPEARLLLGERSPRYLDQVGSTAVLCRRAGQLAEARHWHHRELDLVRQVHPPDHPTVAQAWESLAVTRVAEVRAAEAAGRLDVAFAQGQELLGLIRERLGKEHPHYVGCLMELVELAKKGGDPMAALPYVQEILTLHQSTGGEAHPAFKDVAPDPSRNPAEPAIAVFLSSTFRDMQAEREVLVKRVFPRLRAICEQRGVTWTDIDLRWGVTEEQTQRQEALRVCLHAIDRCRPYFVGLLGERYGWIPAELIDPATVAQYPWIKDHAGRSITELEIVHGVLRQPQDAAQALFYFRDPGYGDRLPAETDRADFLSESPESAAKLQRLKETIRQSGAKVEEGYPTADALGELVFRDLMGVIERRFPADGGLTPEQRETQGQNSFILHRASGALPRLAAYRSIDAHMWTSREPLVVTGPSGVGKTTLLGGWCRQFRAENPATRVAFHFVGATELSARPETLLRHLLAQLGGAAFDSGRLPADVPGLLAALAEQLGSAAQSVRLVLVLDGLEWLDPAFAEALLDAIPGRLPPRVSVIVGFDAEPLCQCRPAMGWPRLGVEPLSMDERRAMVETYLGRFGKRLLDDQVTFLATRPQTGDPLYLRTLLDELRVFGRHEELDHLIAELLKAPTVETLLTPVLDRLQREHETDRAGLVGDALSLLACSDRGLSESELRDLLGAPDRPLPAALWAPLFLALEPLLIQRDGQIDLGAEALRRAVRARYLSGPARVRAIHQRCAEYVETQPRSPRTARAALWHWDQAGDTAALAARLADPDLIRILGTADPEGTVAFWRAYETRQGTCRLETAFAPWLDSPERDPALALLLADLLARLDRREAARRILTALDGADLDATSRAARARLQRRLDAPSIAGSSAPARPDEAAVGSSSVSTTTSPGSSASGGTPLPGLDDLDPDVRAYLTNLARSGADPELLDTETRFFRANAAVGSRNTPAALEEFERVGAVYRRRQIWQRVGLCLIGRVNGLEHLGRHEPALPLIEEAEEIYRQLQDPANLRLALMMRASLLRRLGRTVEARAVYRETIAVCRDLGDVNLLPEILIGYSEVLGPGDPEARAALDEAERLFDQRGDHLGVIRVRSTRRARQFRADSD
ncbi:MAG TPA: DUF4062 domain-containing protein [Thermoguttaceae bacterium]|nr:DUF4062 domain-containing protein [Thermoguttaceae bacterium]